jgi:hypothetical protein
MRVMADVNIEGHVDALIRAVTSDRWRDIWDGLEGQVVRFSEVGLVPSTSDAEVWRTCQHFRIVLITANRNQRGPDSLEAVIRQENTADSLPVFTLSNPELLRRTETTWSGLRSGCWSACSNSINCSAPDESSSRDRNP